MANLKSSKKRILTSARKALENRPVKTRAKTAIKTVVKDVKAGNAKAAQESIKTANKAIDKATNLGLMHKNKAAREKSKLAKLKNNME